MTNENLTAQQLRERLDYNHQTGELTWRVNASSKARIGDVAGGPDSSGYVKIGLFGRDYRAQRLAWLHFYGEWPAGQVDHIDGNPTNNAIANLRDVEQAVNQQNQRRAHASSSHGFLGVSRLGKKWRACIKVGAERMYLGVFGSPEEAHAVYLDAKRRMHTGCTI